MQYARQQQAAFQHADLLIQRAFQLGEVIDLLRGLNIAARQGTDLVGRFQQLFADPLVDQALFVQQLMIADLAGFGGGIADYLLRQAASFLVDDVL